ncbi:dnak suppressor protein [Arthrobacter sp. Hiyo4]|nr:dnak suppressor protein [Arthrobacter sp. Hiyo4]
MPDFERFRVLLEEERTRKLALLPALHADISAANAARQDSNVDDEHDPEGSTIAFELSQASALLKQSSDGLDQVDAALARIAAGTYGTCAVCGTSLRRVGSKPARRRRSASATPRPAGRDGSGDVNPGLVNSSAVTGRAL